ncbi:MAG: hypothetical protein V2J14_06775 [Erythrobacter sp.]|jgi:hypothetical protein|nr:hypothetical protein [Erythrobacter sp.]
MNGRIIGRPKTPWHLWVVAVLGLLWNGGGGASNYINVKLATPEFFAAQAEALGTTPAIVTEYFGTYPLWADILYGLGVWGAVAGSVLLLARSRFAIIAFWASLIGFLGGVVYGVLNPIEGLQNPGLFWGFSAVVGLTLVLQLVYASRMAKAGVLR